jgi:hypothetical protein
MNDETFYCASCNRHKPIEMLAEKCGPTRCRCDDCKERRDAHMAAVHERRRQMQREQTAAAANA